MKKVLMIILVLSLCSMVSAQGFKLGVAGDLTFPTGDWAELYSSGWGAEAFAVIDVVIMNVTARAGYMDFGSTDFQIAPGRTASTKIKAIPILAGLRWDFGVPVGPSFYVGVEAGVTNFTTTYEAEGFTVPGDETESKFTISPNAGVTLLGFELGGYYMIISDANYWGLRLGWGFGI